MLHNLSGSSANKWGQLYCMVQMTLTQTPNSITSSSYFWDSPRVTCLCSQKSLSAGISLYLQPITNCYDSLLWLQLPLLMSSFSKVCRRACSSAYCQFSSGDWEFFWRSKSPSFRIHSSSNCCGNEERRLSFPRTYRVCFVDLSSITIQLQSPETPLESWPSDSPLLIFWYKFSVKLFSSTISNLIPAFK